MDFCQGVRKKLDRFAFLKYITGRSWFCVLNRPNISVGPFDANIRQDAPTDAKWRQQAKMRQQRAKMRQQKD